MAVFKFLFVLALAVPLVVLMRFYINRLLDEFKTNLKNGKNTGVYETKQNRREDRKNPAADMHKPDPYAYERYRQERRESYNNTGSIQRPTQRPMERTVERPPAGGYSSARANFENSRMKQKYEESLRESRSDTNKSSPAKSATNSSKRVKSSENREKSKRQRRAERKRNRIREK